MNHGVIEPGNKECRYSAATIELRASAEDEEAKKVFGYAAKFNTRSENLGNEDRPLYETIAPGAFDEALLDDVRALFNHDPNAILARSKGGSGSLRLGVDEVGLWYEFDAPDTQAGRDLMTSLQRGDIDQSSFSFTVGREGQEWEEARSDDGKVIVSRTIKKVSRLYDVSPVTYPAYPDASVALRSFESFHQEQTAPPVEEPEVTLTPHRSAWAARLGISQQPSQGNNK
jgi:uncharacterized protein